MNIIYRYFWTNNKSKHVKTVIDKKDVYTYNKKTKAMMGRSSLFLKLREGAAGVSIREKTGEGRL